MRQLKLDLYTCISSTVTAAIGENNWMKKCCNMRHYSCSLSIIDSPFVTFPSQSSFAESQEVDSSYPQELAARLLSVASLFLDAVCVAKSDQVNELFESRILASCKAFNKEAIAACRTPTGKENDGNIFNLDEDETQILLEDHYPRGIVHPQYLSEAAIVL
jgi:hypothetical protein